MTFLKFISREHFNELSTRGRIRIGSIKAYRSHDGVMVGDSLDGALKISGTAFNHHRKTNHPILNALVSGPGTVGEIHLSNLRFSSPPALLFCGSHSYSHGMHLQWKQREARDVCFRITDLAAFGAEVTSALQSSYPVRFHGYEKVRYADYSEACPLNIHHPLSRMHPAVVKQRRYRNQTEIRALWFFTDNMAAFPEYIDLEIPGLGRYCEVFKTA